MPHAYRVNVQNLSDDLAGGGARELTFEVTNHDEIMQLVERVRARGILPDDEVAAFTIGLKLFSVVMLRHRQEALFSDLFPHFGAFMKRLKGDTVGAFAP